MSVAGLVITNNGNELVFTSEAYTFGYIGTATYVSTTQPPSSYPSSEGFISEGYSTYTLTWAGSNIMVGLPLATTPETASGIISTTKSGSTWTILVRCGSGAGLNGAGFRPEAAPSAVHVWGTPGADPTYGLIIKDAAGNITSDLSRRPLTINQRLAFGLNVVSTTMASITSPILLTGAAGGRNQRVGDYTNWYMLYHGYRALWYASGTTLYRLITKRQVTRTDGYPEVPDADTTTRAAQTALITSAVGL